MPVKAIRITDPEILDIVEKRRHRHGRRRPAAAVAGQMIIERNTHLELQGDVQGADRAAAPNQRAVRDTTDTVSTDAGSQPAGSPAVA